MKKRDGREYGKRYIRKSFDTNNPAKMYHKIRNVLNIQYFLLQTHYYGTRRSQNPSSILFIANIDKGKKTISQWYKLIIFEMKSEQRFDTDREKTNNYIIENYSGKTIEDLPIVTFEKKLFEIIADINSCEAYISQYNGCKPHHRDLKDIYYHFDSLHGTYRTDVTVINEGNPLLKKILGCIEESSKKF